jgi:hypothetical protein
MRGKYLGSSLGVTVIWDNPATPTKGMISKITNQYCSGIEVGDSRGAYLADTTAETITASGELVTNGTFTTDTSGWTAGGGATITYVAGVMRVTNDATGVNYGYAYQTIATVVGKTYTISYTKIGGTAAGLLNIGSIAGGSNIIANSVSPPVTFVAVGTTTYISMTVGGNAASVYYDFDNISVKLADADRSVKNNGLNIIGTLNKSAVATGSQLVAYSGFSASNYLEQPYSANLDFGTGDFCVMGWVTTSSVIIFERASGGVTGGSIVVQASVGTLQVFSSASGYGSVLLNLSGVVSNSPSLVTVFRASGVIYAYVGATLVGSVANTANVSNTSAVVRVGTRTDGNTNGGSVALVRISATAPSADQIAHIYRTELPLFQPNAQCTIAGTSTAVTALAYDDVADTLHVGTSWGRTSFRDLLRIDSEATTTGAITSLSANEGVVFTGGASSAKVYAPALNIRDAVMQGNENRYGPNNYITSLGNISSVNGGALAGLRNRIINGGMSVSQRNGATATAVGTTASSSYNVDRWQTYRTGAVTGATSTGLQLTGLIGGPLNFTKVQRDSGNTSTAAIILATSLESGNILDLQGKTVTLSFWLTTVGAAQTNGVQAQISTGTGTDGNHFAGFANPNSVVAQSFAPSNWTRCSITGVVPQSATQLGVNFLWIPTGTAGASDYFGITGVQLELGLVATPFEHRPYGMELALCQRYYEPWGLWLQWPGATGQAAGGVVQFLVQKRNTPTINTGSFTFGNCSSFQVLTAQTSIQSSGFAWNVSATSTSNATIQGAGGASAEI